MRFPSVGITTKQTFDIEKHFEGYKYVQIIYCFIEAISGSGGVPYILPIYEKYFSQTALIEQIKKLDGIILSDGEYIKLTRDFLEANAKIAHDQKTHFNEVTHIVHINQWSITNGIASEIWVNGFHHMTIKNLPMYLNALEPQRMEL